MQSRAQEPVKNLHVVSISSEMVPFAKTGGLGDVCGALPPALEPHDCRVSCFLPAYRSVINSGIQIEPTNHTFTVHIADRFMACRLLKTQLPGSSVDVYLIDQPHYFDRAGLYAEPGGADYPDNCERFSFYCQAVLEAIDQLKLDVDIAHCHDWQTGLIPAYVKTRFRQYAWMERCRTIMTIHNLAYQGTFWHLDMPLTGMDWKHFNWQEMEFYGQLNFLKTGLVFADTVTTVSPTYAQEITTPEHGCGLESILQDRGDRLVGIVNGVDYEQWDPAHDSHLRAQYGLENWKEEKLVCKRELQKELGLEQRDNVPLVGIVSRLADQKGWDLIIPLLIHWAKSHDVQWAILGTGDPRYEKQLAELAELYPTKIGAKLAFSEGVAHRIEAGCDMFLMPSRYEPCGLNQLYSLKYGSVPVVHTTGGLADTVIDTTPKSLAEDKANGFCFPEYDQKELEKTLTRAVETYLHQPEQWAQIVESGMRMDWSWSQSASRYLQVYGDTMER